MKPINLLPYLMLCPIALSAQTHKKMNVIYIYADDMGKGMLSAYGQTQFTTPNIDGLIQQGTSFSNAYGCMLSAPSRASLLTGYHDCHTDKWKITDGAKFLFDVKDTANIAPIEMQLDESDVRLPEEDYYLPQVFQKAGYVTAQIGKLEWGFTATRQQMRDHGWDYYYGYLDHVCCHGYYPPFLFDNGAIVPIEGNTIRSGGKSMENETPQKLAERWNRQGKEVYSQDIFIDKILSFIRENKDRPFFLYHPSQLPHGPVAIPAIHPELANNPNLTTLEKEYASMVKLLDATVGAILCELERQGIAENTIVVFSSDNGHEIYYSQTGRCEKPYRDFTTGQLFDNYKDKYYSDKSGDIFNGNAGMSGMKRSNLEGGIHIPLVFYCKGVIPEGKVCTDLVSNYDFLPTMADLLNIPLSVRKDGRSFLPSLLHGKSATGERYLIFGSNEGPAIIMNNGWKLRCYLKENVWELFYLPDDPQERHDLSKEQPKRVKEMKELLMKECGGDVQNGINRYG